MSNLREYIVCLHTFEDLESFYNDMETPGGNFFIPSRAVDVAKRKPVSRNTHYWLSDDEACKVGQDPRVMFVELTPEERGISFKLTAATEASNDWNKSKIINNLQHNWGLLRSTEGTQRPNWGRDGTTTVNGTVNLAYTGANVDIVMADGHFLNTHPEFAVNADGSGGSRFVAYNWYQLNPTVTGGAPGTYDVSNTTYNFHATHTAGIAAGNTHGWARSANIYNISIFLVDSNYLFNYVKVFHQTKAVNPATGRKNPTVMNCSFETVYDGGATKLQSDITQVVYRGTTYNGPFSRAQLEGYNFVFDSLGRWIPPTQTSSINVDMLDAIGAGVIVCAVAGNAWQKIAEVGDSDWNNSCIVKARDGSLDTVYYNRGSFSAPTGGGNRAIVVGGVSDKTAEYKLFMSSTGPRVDIYSPAESINSSWPNTSNPYNDPSWYAYEPANPVLDSRGSGYNFKLSGTSMAAPQVAGVIAALMEYYYTWTPAQALAYIQTTAGIGQLGEITDPASQYNLKGATNRYLYYSTDGTGPGGPVVVTPTYAVAASTSSVNEGGTVTYTITTTDVANGTTLYWTNRGNTNAADFSDNSNSGSFAISSNSGSFTRTLRNDLTTEGAETIIIEIRTTAVTGTVVATASSVTVNDTSTTPTQPTATGQILSPTIFSPIPNYVYDPASGNFNLPPGNGNWASSTRWQGANPGTLIQAQINLFTSSIDTNVLPFRDAGGSLGPYNTVAYVNPTGTIQRPFGDYLEISFGASVDSFSTNGGGVVQLTAYIYLKNPDGTFFVMFFSVYDSRPEYYNYTPIIGGTGTDPFVFASTPVGNTKYCTSNQPMTTAGAGYTNYTIRFTKTHFATAIADLVANGADFRSKGNPDVSWLAQADWIIYEIGLTHQVIHFNDPAIQVNSAVSFTSPLVSKTTLQYPTNYTFTQGYPSYNTIIDGVQCFPDAYDIQFTQANGRNVGAGVMTVKFDWRSHRYWEFNPNDAAHTAFILRASENHVRGNIVLTKLPLTPNLPTRGNQGTGYALGNLRVYYNADTGHRGNPIQPSTMIETWYQGPGTGGGGENDILPGSWGNMVLQDDVTYQTEINAIIDSNGKSFVSYKLVSGGITIFDCPPIADDNIWYDPKNTGIIFAQVLASGNNDPADPWRINITNLSVTWSANTAGFTITPDKTTVNEGDTITWTVTTTNIPNGTVLYWTRSGTTEGVDFSDAVISPYDGYSGVVTINNNIGTFSRTAALDNLTEGTETAIMSIRQGSKYGTVEATAATVYILDTSTGPTGGTWSITPNVTTVNEGERVTWTVTTDAPDGTYWWTNEGTTTDPDFSDFIAGPGNPGNNQGTFYVSNGTGSFYKTTAIDNLTEGTETIIMKVRRGSATDSVVATSPTVYVLDTSTNPSGATWSVVPTATTVNEGDTVTWNVATTGVANGTYYWTISGTTTAPDFSDLVLGPSDGMSGEFTITSGSGSFSKTLALDNITEGTETIIMKVRTGSAGGTIVATAATVNVLDTSTNPSGAIWAVTPDKTSVNEGGTVTWNVATTGVANGTYYWTISGTTDAQDFSDVVLGPSDGMSGEFTITSGSGSFSKTLALDNITEGPETIIMKIRTGSIGGPIVATAVTVTVNDTSITPQGEIWSITPDKTSVDEGGTVTWTVTTTNVPDGTYYWNNSGTTDTNDFSDFVVGGGSGTTMEGSFTITAGVGSFSRRLYNDLKTEGPETIIMNVRKNSTIGTIMRTAVTVTVNDTSTTPVSTPTYSVAPDRTTVNEGGAVTWNVLTANVADGTTLYWTNSGTTDDYDFADFIPGGPTGMSGSFTVTGGVGSFSRTLANDVKLEGTETIIMSIRTGSIGGTVVATAATVNVLDTSVPVIAVTYIAVPNKTNVNEGEVVTWTVTTTGVQDRTVLYWTNVGTTDNADFNDTVVGPSDTLSGSFVITANSGSFSRSITKDNKTEGTETIIMKIRTGSIAGPVVYTAPTVYVNDTSLSPPVYSVNPNVATVKEGDTVIYTVHTESVPLNTILFWTIDGIGTTTNAQDFSDLVSKGTVVISSADPGIGKAHGRITRRLLKDNLKEGTESMILRVRIGSTDGPIVATASPVRVIDTSRNPIINWASTGSLGTLLPGQISELYVKAVFNTSTVYPKYTISGGVLPSGLVMERDGTVSGQVKVDTSRTSFTETSTFVVTVTDPNNKSLLNGQFSITVKQTESTDRTDIYCRPFLSQDKRDSFRSFIRNESVFPANMLYRTFDPNFGRQEDLTVYIDFGVEKLTYEEYANISVTNFYKRPLSIGGIKTAVAKNTNGTVRYEFVYLDVIDKHVNSSKISIPLEFTFNGVTYYPPSIPNMRSRIAEKSTISTVRYPSFTNYVQAGDSVKLGYIPFIPLCYTLPGKSGTIIRKITESGFKFNTINFELDRLVIKDVQYENGAKYLLLSRDTKLA